jgi:hypothetical protein
MANGGPLLYVFEKRGRYPLFVNLRERSGILSTLCVSRFAKEPHPGHF